jgi:hypothetical protein
VEFFLWLRKAPRQVTDEQIEAEVRRNGAPSVPGEKVDP